MLRIWASKSGMEHCEEGEKKYCQLGPFINVDCLPFDFFPHKSNRRSRAGQHRARESTREHEDAKEKNRRGGEGWLVTHHDLHTNHTIQTPLAHAEPRQHIPVFEATVDQGVLAIDPQPVRAQLGQEALPKGPVGLHPVNMLDAGRVEPAQLEARAGAQVEDHAVGGGDEARDGLGGFVGGEMMLFFF